MFALVRAVFKRHEDACGRQSSNGGPGSGAGPGRTPARSHTGTGSHADVRPARPRFIRSHALIGRTKHSQYDAPGKATVRPVVRAASMRTLS